MLPSPSTSGQQVPLRTAPPFRNPLWISRLLSALLFLQRAEGQLLSLEKLGQTALACLKQHSIKQTQEPTRVSSLLETALKSYREDTGSLAHDLLQGVTYLNTLYETHQRMNVTRFPWWSAAGVRWSLSHLVCDCTKSHSVHPCFPDAVTRYLLPNALDSYQLLIHPQATLLLFIPICVLFQGCYTHVFILNVMRVWSGCRRQVKQRLRGQSCPGHTLSFS